MSNKLLYKGYSGTANFSAESEVFYGKINSINDLVTFEGSSVEELKNAFNESVDDYLETCIDFGDNLIVNSQVLNEQ